MVSMNDLRTLTLRGTVCLVLDSLQERVRLGGL
jgi:hypothetical protein